MSNMVKKQRTESNVSEVDEEPLSSDDSEDNGTFYQKRKTMGLNLLDIEAAKGAKDDDSGSDE